MIKWILLIAYIIVVGFIAFNSYLEGYYLEELIDWLVLFGLLFFYWQFKRSSSFLLNLSFALFLVASLIIISTFDELGEAIMRLSFINLMVGFIFAFLENIKKLRAIES